MVRHVVALSGGKDSTAMALRLAEVEPRPYRFVCTPTGDEMPGWADHMKTVQRILGQSVIPLSAHSLAGLVRHYDALPNWRQRWCTRQLKIEPFIGYLTKHSPAVSYVGLRADEPKRIGPIYDDLPGVSARFPLREWGWGLGDVRDYLASQKVVVPERTDCARCFFQTLGEWWVLWKDHPEIYADAEKEEAATGHTYRSPGRDSWPAGLAALRERFESGAVPRGAAQLVLGDAARRKTCRVCTL